ncbi:PAS domain S-box protein [Mongoliimonas terrestris]|uniref:PAS domain S-box protein n=1 Tax=Mongoliimonas terrestris TaxID=1709001 RepID=UPI00094998A5|nr:PAS domain S-box protein [Mongoliimonas terrestris]
MREIDWAATPLGRPNGWPASLRTVVGLLLSSSFPMFVAWGPDLRFLYNDGYADILGRKHPAAMGARFQDVWSEIWHEVGPLASVAMAGEAVYRRDLPLFMNRHGRYERTWFTFSYSPLRDDNDQVRGMFCAVTETTETVIAGRRHDFRRGLEERLRPLAQPRDIIRAAAAYLGGVLGVGRVGYGEVEGDQTHVTIEEDWTDSTMASVAGRLNMNAFGPPIIAELKSGLTMSVDNVSADQRLTPDAVASFMSIEARSVLAVPLIKGGVFLAMLFLHTRAPRAWDAEEKRLAEEVAERTWAAVQKARADAALRASEDHYRNAIELNPQVSWTARPDGQLDHVSTRWKEWTGTTGLGATWAEGLHPDDRERTFEVWATSLSTGEPYDIEHRVQRLTGKYRWARSRAFPRRDHRGEVVKWYGNTEDIHERKEAEEELKRVMGELADQAAARTRERNRLWELSRDLFAIMGLDGYLKLVNPAWTRLLGHSEQTLLTTHFSHLVHPDDHEAIAWLVQRLSTGQTVEGFEDRILHADGRYRWISWTAVPEGEIFYAVGRDITEDREREEHLRQAQKIEAIGALTGGVAHDFNNLLTVISGGLDMLGRTDDRDRLRRIMDGMRQAVDRGATLSRQLLTFARRQPLKAEPFDVAGQLDGMRDLLDRSLRGDVIVRFDLADGLWPVKADPGEFVLAVLNLAVNARDAMPRGGTIILSGRNRSGLTRGDDAVEISVADTGEGMSPEVLARAFDPFFTTKDIGKGSGLGLAQVHGFVTSSGGRVEIRSSVGAGTTVLIRLPRSDKMPDLLAAPAVPADLPPPLSCGKAGCILLVEDDQEVAALAVQMLADLGYEAIHAANGHDALGALAKARHIDAVFSDIMMPGGMNGVELAREIKARRPGLPVILTSGYADAAVLGDGEPGQTVLPKPYRLSELGRVLGDALARERTDGI